MTFDDISDVIENDNCITARWIAIQNGITVNKATDLISSYYKNNKGRVKANYTMSGFDSTGSKLFIVVNEDKLEEAKAKFQKITSQKIHSLQKESEGLNSHLASQDADQAVEMLLMKHPNCGSFMSNSSGCIRIPDLSVVAVGERVLAAHNEDNEVKAPSLAKKETAEEHMSRMFANKSSAPAKKTTAAASNYFSSIAKDSTAAKTKSPFDGSSSRTPSRTPSPFVRADTADTQTTLKTAASTSESVVGIAMTTDANDDEDAEWDDGTGYKVDPSRLAKRTAKKISTSDDEQEAGDSSADEEEGEGGEGGDVSGDKRKSKRAKKHVRGAMDDYMEDVAIAEFKATHDAETGEKVKRYKKKQVEKVSYSVAGVS